MDGLSYKSDVEPKHRSSLPELNSSQLAGYGLAIILCTWAVFLLGMVMIMKGWKDPENTVHNYTKYEDETGYPIPLYYMSLIFLFPVVAWIWSLISWMGMKFFRHAGRGVKGDGA